MTIISYKFYSLTQFSDSAQVECHPVFLFIILTHVICHKHLTHFGVILQAGFQIGPPRDDLDAPDYELSPTRGHQFTLDCEAGVVVVVAKKIN